MIAPVKEPRRSQPVPAWHAGFLGMLPQIQRHAEAAFRRFPAETREDLVQETVANALTAYARLVERGKTDAAHPSVLARYAAAQVREGRRVGGKLNVRDVSSRYAQRKKHLILERLDHFDRQEGAWIEAVVEDHHTPVGDQAAFRLDFPRWLALYPRRDRRIVELLAAGHGTGEVARRFHLSSGRISQKRQEYFRSWQRYHGENTIPNPGTTHAS